MKLQPTAALSLFALAGLHVPAILLVPSNMTLQMVTAIVLWVILGMGVRSGSKGATWLALAGLIFGLLTTTMAAQSTSGLASALFWIILAVTIAALVLVAGVLWSQRSQGKPQSNEPGPQ